MSVLDTDKVDLIGLRTETGEVVLTISDHLDWNEPEQHLLTLQNKINTYIAFIESEEIHQVYPESIGRKLCIEIVTQSKYPPIGLEFLKRVQSVLESIEVSINTKVLV